MAAEPRAMPKTLNSKYVAECAESLRDIRSEYSSWAQRFFTAPVPNTQKVRSTISFSVSLFAARVQRALEHGSGVVLPETVIVHVNEQPKDGNTACVASDSGDSIITFQITPDYDSSEYSSHDVKVLTRQAHALVYLLCAAGIGATASVPTMTERGVPEFKLQYVLRGSADVG